MNLFENLQALSESENKLVSEFKEFLKSKNASYIATEIGETENGMQLVIYDGDWKHEHLYMKQLLDEFFTNKGIDISIESEQIEESDQDTFSARYNVIFNSKPETYTADVISENINTSNWKQRFKGMDVYISDKYPDYQIKKSYTSSKQEVWQVLNFKTQREVFVASTFEQAIDFVENGKTPRKPKALDKLNNVEESNHNEILDKDYATGEKLYNGLKEYLDSIDQIAMDGDDCNWEPSEYNAKNLNADGEIYLVSGAYVLIYPYINEWAEDYFKVFVVEASDLQSHVKAGIENIFNKYKTDKWKLVFEG